MRFVHPIGKATESQRVKNETSVLSEALFSHYTCVSGTSEPNSILQNDCMPPDMLKCVPSL